MLLHLWISSWLLLFPVQAWPTIRRLAIGDFVELNALVENAVIRLPDFSGRKGIIQDLSITDLRCTDFHLGDIVVATRSLSSTSIEMQLDVVQLDMACNFSYSYDTWLFGGDGTASVSSMNNTARTNTIFTSTDFSQHPPTSSRVDSCSAAININELSLSSSILGLAPVESFMRRVVQSKAQGLLCDKLTQVSTNDLVDMLEHATRTLEKYPRNYNVDPLQMERDLLVPANDLVSWQDTTPHTAGETVRWALHETVTYLSTKVNDTVHWSGTDMRINALLRNTTLRERALILEVSDVSIAPDGILYNRHDRLTKTTVSVDSIKLMGLDTLTVFHPLDAIGNQTLQNRLSWEYLTFEVGVTIAIQPSTLPDSFIDTPGDTNVVEKVIIRFGIDRIDAVATFLLAVDHDKLENIQLGSLLYRDRILPCLLSTIVELQLSSLSVNVSNLVPPTLDGFVSIGIDRVVSDSVNAAFQLYQAALLEALPAFFESSVRNFLNQNIRTELFSQTYDCPLVATIPDQDDYVDLRDLLLTPGQASDEGAAGLEPYGNVTPSLYSLFQEKLMIEDSNSEPKINSIIRSFAESQTGQQTLLSLSRDVFRFEKELEVGKFASLVEKIIVKAFNASVENLDTIVSPFLIMYPDNAFTLRNTLNFGPISSRPIKLSTRMLFDFYGEDSPLSMKNDVEISLYASSASVNASFVATILETKLLQFLINDVFDIHCWLALFPNVQVDHLGNLVNPGSEIGLLFSGLTVFISELKLNVRCVSCSSPGGEGLADLIGTAEKVGIVKIFEKTVESLMQEIAESYWRELQVPQLITESKHLCRHSQYYDEAATSSFVFPSFPTLSLEAAKSVIVLLLFSIEFALISTAQNHLLRPTESTNPLSAQSTLQIADGVRLLDWTNLNESIGSWADSALEKARLYLAETVDGEQSLRINSLLRGGILDDEGLWCMKLNDVGFDVMGSHVSIKSVSIAGLDTISKIEVLKIIGAQTFQHLVEFDQLEFGISFEIQSSKDTQLSSMEAFSASIGMADVAISMATFLAVDLAQLEDIEIQSLLKVEQLFPCFLSKVHDFSFPQMLVEMSSIGDLKFAGDLEETFVLSAGKLIDAFRTELVAAIPTIFDSTIRKVMNAIIQNYREGPNGFCTLTPVTAELIDFRDLFLPKALSKQFGGTGNSPYGNTLQKIFDAVQMQMSLVDATNRSLINDMVIRPWTTDQSGMSGVLSYYGDVVSANTSVVVSGFNGDIEFKVKDVRFENLDSVADPLSLLQPVPGSGSSLQNMVGLGGASLPIRLTVNVVISISDGKKVDIHNEIDVALEVNSMVASFSIFVALAQKNFFSFPMRDIMNYNCWLSTISTEAMSKISGTDFIQYAVSARMVDLNISCISCSSPRFDELIYHFYSPGRGDEDTSSFVNSTLSYFDQLIGSDFLRDYARRILDNAATQCPHHESFDVESQIGQWPTSPITYLGFETPRRDKKMSLFNAANAIMAVILIVAAVIFRSVVIKRKRRWTASLSREQLAVLDREDEKEQQKAKYLDECIGAMYRSQYIPYRIRCLVPFVIVFNIGLCLGGHLGLISYLNIQGQVAGEEFIIDHFLDFSFFTNTIKTYNNGGNEMAVLIFIFTGIWPYVKLITALFVWFAPPKWISVSRRGSIFLWLDVFTKLSIVDIFMTLIALAAVLVYSGGPDTELQTNAELYNMKIICVPFWGFYSILISQRINRVSTRFFLDYHRKIVMMASTEYNLKLKASLYLEDDFDLVSPDGIDRDYTGALSKTNRAEVVSGNEDDEEKTSDETCRTTKCTSTVRTGRPVGPDATVICFGDSFDDESSPPVHGGNRDPLESPASQETSFHTSSRVFLLRSQVLAGTIGVSLAGITVVLLFIIAIILAPSVSLKVDNILSIALESGRTYEDFVNEFNVFRLISLVLLNARFVLNSKWDYVGLGISLFLAIVTSVLFPAIQAYTMLREWWKQRKDSERYEKIIAPPRLESSIGFPYRLRALKHIEVYIISFVIASWQLAAVTVYVIHNYCVLMGSLFNALAYIGFVEKTSSQCFRVQASAASTMFIFVGSFVLLLTAFVFQARAQYLTNKREVDEMGCSQRQIHVLPALTKVPAL